MRAIIVDDEPIMLRSFSRYSKGIEGLEILEMFNDHLDALAYADTNSFDVAFLDIEMPEMNGLELAKELLKRNPELLIVFVTAYDNYIREANELGAVYYLMKPYKKEMIESLVKRLSKLLGQAETDKRKKDIYVQTFGVFTVFHKGVPVRLVGKSKEILALIVTRCGKEISNEELYTTIWENRVYDNTHMKVYYNALRRLRDRLAEEGIPEILISTTRGQIINTDVFDCDYYAWKNNDSNVKYDFEGEFMSEFSWGEELLAAMLEHKAN